MEQYRKRQSQEIEDRKDSVPEDISVEDRLAIFGLQKRVDVSAQELKKYDDFCLAVWQFLFFSSQSLFYLVSLKLLFKWSQDQKKFDSPKNSSPLITGHQIPIREQPQEDREFNDSITSLVWLFRYYIT